MLFDEWDKLEWLKFYNYMITCLRMYLINGLVAHDFKNLDIINFSYYIFNLCQDL